MARFILRLDPGPVRRSLSWNAVMHPFRGKIEILDRSTDVMILVEAEESVVQQIVAENEGIKYFQEKTYPLPDERPKLS